MSPAIAGAIRDHTVSQANMPRYERARSLFGYNDDSDASDTEEEAAAVGVEGFAKSGREARRCDVRWAQNHSRSTEFIMPMMMRWCNMHSHCFILYAFSCINFATGARSIVRGLLLSLRIVYSKETIRESMLQVGRRIMQLRWEGTSCSIGLCVSDNCACYMNKLTYQHAEKDGHFFETVTYL